MLNFVWIDCEGCQDPVMNFWILVRDGALASKCNVVFTNANAQKPGLIRAWEELSKQYGGARFGSLYVVEYTDTLKPQVVSSMKGCFN
jgi:hypothetical protein